MDIISEFDIEELYMNSFKNSEYENEISNSYKVNFISKSEYLNNHIYIINYHDKDENDDSIVTYLIEPKVLLMGDASSKVEAKINISNINILKVGHHGSKTSSSASFINRVRPKISLISVGLKNKFGHPAKETLERLKDSLVLMTSVNGMIKINLKTLECETRS